MLFIVQLSTAFIRRCENVQLQQGVSNPSFMILEAETRLVIQGRLKATISWEACEVGMISTAAERILSEFIQIKMTKMTKKTPLTI